MTPLGFAAVLLRRWRLFAVFPMGCAVVAVAWATISAQYTARSTFTTQDALTPRSDIAGLAAQFGFTLPTASNSASPEFYAGLLRSRRLLEDLALTEYLYPDSTNAADTPTGNLLDIYEISGSTRRNRLQRVVTRLRSNVTTDVDRATQIVTVATKAPWADLAEQLNRRVLDLVHEFNEQGRQSNARAEREFLSGRWRTAEDSLIEAESQLQRFLERNRRYMDSPELVFVEARLQRRVQLRQEVHTSLVQAYEQARIEEVRDTPVLTVIDPPEGSAVRRRGGVVKAFVGLVLGGLVAVAVALIGEYLARERQLDTDDFRAFERARMSLTSAMRLGRKARAR